MFVEKRTATLTVAGGASTSMDISVNAYKRLMVMDVDYLTPRVVATNSNTELTLPTTITLSDPNLPGRYVLLSSNITPHTLLGYMVYYDNKYNDILVLPTLEPYKLMSYISGKHIKIDAYGVNFTGKLGGTMPVPNTGYDITSTIVRLGSSISKSMAGGRFETDVTPSYRVATPATGTTAFINFGTPLTMFTTLGFVTNINVFGYDSLYEWGAQNMGNKPLTNIGTLVVELPL